MEYEKQTGNNTGDKEYVSLRFKKPNKSITLMIITVLVVVVILLFFKGIFIAASVNGDLISRRSVMKELERQGGKQVLDEMINNKLIASGIKKADMTISKEDIDKEIENVKLDIQNQGGVFEDVLKEQGATEETLREQIVAQKKLEKILSDKIAVTDTEIDAYLKSSKTKKPTELTKEDFRTQIREGLGQQKFQQASKEWLSEMKSNAKIKYYVNY